MKRRRINNNKYRVVIDRTPVVQNPTLSRQVIRGTLFAMLFRDLRSRYSGKRSIMREMARTKTKRDWQIGREKAMKDAVAR